MRMQRRSRLQGLAVGEQAGGAAGVQEDDVLALGEMALADEVDQAGGALTAVDRVEQQALCPRREFDRGQRLRRRISPQCARR